MQAHMTEVYAWIDSLTKQGIFSAAQPLTPEGKVVSGGSGSPLPMASIAESKEAVGGFFILNVETMDEAVEIARSSPDVQTRRQAGGSPHRRAEIAD